MSFFWTVSYEKENKDQRFAGHIELHKSKTECKLDARKLFDLAIIELLFV